MKKMVVPFLAMVFMSVIAEGVVAATSEPLVQATFTTNPITANVGSDGYVQLTLKNAGTAVAGRIKITSVSHDPDITTSGTWTGELSPLGSGDSITSLFKFQVSGGASLGLHVMTFYIDYSSDSSTSGRTINPNVIVNVQSPSNLELISVEPSSLSPGEKEDMSFTVKNNGDSPLSNVVFTWSSSDNVILPLGSSNRVLIPRIEANSEYSVISKVSVSLDTAPGLYPLTTNIQYYDKSGSSRNTTSTSGIEIGGGTDFDVSSQESSSGSVSLSVANIGISSATSVTISVPDQESFSVSGASSVFLGDLNSGDYTIASFQLTSRNAMNATQMLPNVGVPGGRNMTGGMPAGMGASDMLKVNIYYTDTMGMRQIVEKEVIIDSASSTSFASGTQMNFRQGSNGLGVLTYVIIALVGVAIAIAVFKLLKRKKK